MALHAGVELPVITEVTGSALTFIVPLAVTAPHPPVNVTVYPNEPVADGVPLMVTTPPDQLPDTPAGKPENVAPVAPVVEYVIFVTTVPEQTV
jgi:hypothetical protein